MDSDRNLTPDECNGGLDSEGFNCLWGGESLKNGWIYRSVSPCGHNHDLAVLEA
jgi:hypothetical protein